MKKYLTGLLVLSLLFVFKSTALADNLSIDFESPTYTVGSINGQNGWSATGAYDQGVVSSPVITGSQSFRISNAVTSGSFGDQTFSKSLANEAGETSSTNNGMSGGTRQNHFEAQFDLKSTQLDQQSGLAISVSPDRGDGSRMSYLRFEDSTNGINVFFDDVQGTTNPANFVETQIGTDLTRTTSHTFKIAMDFIDGASNDVVKVWIDGSLVHTGTSWENYYRFDTEASAEQTPRTTDDLLIRAGGTAAPDNSGKGYLFDNLSLLSGPIPTEGPTSASVNIYKYIDGELATAVSANNADFPMLTTFTSTVHGNAVDAPYTLGAGGWGGGPAYQAAFPNANIGANYATHEVTGGNLVGNTCDTGQPYALLGYTTGDTLQAATDGEPSATVPSFTNLQSDKYVIVWNQRCPIKVHILKYLDGVKADSISAGGYQFPMTATWQTSNLNGGLSTSGNYVLGNFHGGAADQYGADTAAMNVPADYTTSEITDASSQVVTSLTACVPGKYLLNGYRTSEISFADAALQALTTAPIFTALTSDRFVIVDNSKCPSAPTLGSISGMKYNDKNRNGQKDPGENGLSGWVIRLKQGNTVIKTTTDASGNYSFTNLSPGVYKVRETHQKGWKRMSKNPKPIVLISGGIITDVNFGNAQKQRNEKEDDDRDDDHDDESGYYYPGHGRGSYERDFKNNQWWR